MESGSAQSLSRAASSSREPASRTGFAALAGSPLPGTTASGAHVVVAEDDPDLRAAVTTSLRSHGCEVTECRTGIELIDLLTSLLIGPNRRRVDLVISDVRLHGLSGLDVLGAVRRLANAPPTILITSFGDARARAQARRRGAVAWFDKPIDVEKLIGRAREVLRIRSSPLARQLGS